MAPIGIKINFKDIENKSEILSKNSFDLEDSNWKKLQGWKPLSCIISNVFEEYYNLMKIA